jgi:hypothetical protein
MQSAGEFLGSDGPLLSLGEAQAAATPAVPSHLDLTTRVRPGGLSPEQMRERATAVEAANARGDVLQFPERPTTPPVSAEALRGRGIGVEPMGPEAAPEAPVKKASPKKARAKPKAAPRESASDFQRAFSDLKLSPAEAQQAVKWLDSGVPAEKVIERIQVSRKLTGATGAPTPDEAAAAISQRNTTGRWPE